MPVRVRPPARFSRASPRLRRGLSGKGVRPQRAIELDHVLERSRAHRHFLPPRGIKAALSVEIGEEAVDPAAIALLLQPGAFVKWREASATLNLPDNLAARLRARNASLVFSARNIKTWTNYRGTSPESDFQVGEGGDSPSEFQTFSQPTFFTFRINFAF